MVAPTFLHSAAAPPWVAAGEAGDRPRGHSVGSSLGSCTSCCVGSLGAASGSDLPFCLFQYNCSLLNYFFFLLSL